MDVAYVTCGGVYCILCNNTNSDTKIIELLEKLLMLGLLGSAGGVGGGWEGLVNAEMICSFKIYFYFFKHMRQFSKHMCIESIK